VPRSPRRLARDQRLAGGLGAARERTDPRSPRCHEQAEDRSGKQKLQLRRERARAVPAAAAVKELLSARAQRREHVLEVRCRSPKRSQGRRIERAASRGEQGNGREPASDLEAAAADVLVRDAVCGEVERGSKQQRAPTRTGECTSRRTSCHMERNDHRSVTTRSPPSA
jgi:hypothetical protein